MPNFSLGDAVFQAAAERFPTPFYLYDERGIRKAARELRAAFSWNGGFREYFAVKALPNPAVLKIFLEEGCGLDCSSMPELILAQRLGAKGEDVMFTANAMPGAELAFARELGAIVNLDDLNDIGLLHGNGGIPELVSIRVNPGRRLEGHSRIMGGAEDAKFGWMPSQVPEGLEKLKALGAKRFALHAMTLSNSLDWRRYAAGARYLFHLGLEMEETAGLPLAFVNLSGGLGIPYRPEEQAVDVPALGEMIREEYGKAFGGRTDVGVKTELGRLMTGPYGWLVARAVHRKDIYRTYIGLDASACNLMRPAMYGAYHHVSVAGKRDAPADRVYDLTGPLCENNDKFAVRRPLPEIETGDLVLIHDAGAHGHSMGYQYNGRLRSAEVLLTADGDFRLIRRAETPEDYFRTLVEE